MSQCRRDMVEECRSARNKVARGWRNHATNDADYERHRDVSSDNRGVTRVAL
jgi:hypothetical protein